MLKKSGLVLVLLFFSTSLFAFSQGEKYLYPLIGAGFSSSSSEALKGRELGYVIYASADGTEFKDPESEASFAWSMGVMFDYFFSDNMSFTAGITYDSSPAEIKYPANTAPDGDLVITASYKFLTIPVGLHYVINNFLLIGGGFYYANVMDDKVVIKDDADSFTYPNVKSNNDAGIFIDAGLTFDMSEESNILIFARYKHGMSEVNDGALVAPSGETIVDEVKMQTLTINAAYGIKF